MNRFGHFKRKKPKYRNNFAKFILRFEVRLDVRKNWLKTLQDTFKKYVSQGVFVLLLPATKKRYGCLYVDTGILVLMSLPLCFV